MSDLPTQAQVVIVGGGIVGCSVAYHLTRRGITDVLLLERRQLTCGTTWHAAGLVGQLRATRNMTRLAQYTTDLYTGLEAETGQATGFSQRGSLAVAWGQGRWEELRRGAAMARRFGLEVNELAPDEAAALWPGLAVNDLVGAVHLPRDGQTNPVDTTMALAKGARQRGARIIEGVQVSSIRVEGGRATGVEVIGPDGAPVSIAAETVVNCAGMWGRDLAARAGATVPLHAAEHFYVVTEAIPGLPRDLPVLRDPGNCIYVKEDAGKLMIGCFEPVAKPWPARGEDIPDTFCFDELPEDWEHLEPILDAAIRRVPQLEHTGLQVFFNGPESFTPDDRYLLGETPEVRNLFVAAGFNSIGIQSAGGAGVVLADWIADGHPPMDLWDVDIRRMMPFQRNRRYLRDRTVETLGLLYAMHWPHRQPETARPVRTSALHERLEAAGACFGELAGWERPNWFAPNGVAPVYEYSYGRQNWFPYSAAEHRAVREAVSLFDQSSFAKLLVQGRDALAVLDRLSTARMDVPVGRVVYTQWLNPRGGIEADVTVTRLGRDRFMVVSPGACQTRDRAWVERHIRDGEACVVTDVTSGIATIGLMGPNSRDLMQRLTDADLSDAAFPFMTSQEIEVGYALVRAARVTYVGELGWELYVPTEFARGVYDAIIAAAGDDLGLTHAGYHALHSLRLEGGYRSFGHDISDEDTPLEAGLGFTVAWDKGDFIGRDALLKAREANRARGGPTRRLVSIRLDDPEPLLHHEEPVWHGDTCVGAVAVGMYGHTLGAAVGLAWIEHPEGVTAEWISRGDFRVEIAGVRHPARLSLKPFYDPTRARVRG
ncbi:Sarcosine dehydrogenase [Caenispirillum salinarum AK4]|uniref:Sarcosine dehydrogenase n=1 Tax=Caenispirillum salinarum AK4 TaxID=1238182 RepID=K9HMK2_9PROT|nr:FAD-dependent oxidoreductase [Caenispirillum salinarum]EKV29766.1 Sarcosine dehydrogenase [Caenispirillum salinarum AK4]